MAELDRSCFDLAMSTSDDTFDFLIVGGGSAGCVLASHNWHFNAVPQHGLNARRGYQPRGKGLGGSSAINAMVHVRDHGSDHDAWAGLVHIDISDVHFK